MKQLPATEKTPGSTSAPDQDLIVVGIGASAGGIKALKSFFSAMPPDPGMAFVVVLHLSPEHESNLDAILQGETSMPVIQVNELVPVKPNEVYVIPPNKRLALVDGVIRLSPAEKRTGPRVVIDYFFRTLAEAYAQNAVCLILSGTGSDGSLGLKYVKQRNGFAIAQEPDDAEYDAMPRSAIATNLVDWILPVQEMPTKLIRFKESSERLRLTEAEEKRPTLEVTGGEELREILTLIRVRTGHDFSNYKHPTLLRRIARHVQIHELEDIGSYLKLLRENPLEMQSLLKNLLINVTNFFRDKDAWLALEKEVLPELFVGKTGRDSVRVWSVGAASGEEAYSLAMLLAEHAEQLTDPPKLQIFASDVDEDAIAEARERRYPVTIEADVSPERLRRFFLKENDCYQVRKDLRELILFVPHNVLSDPPFSRLDLVLCRNLLIYLNRETQDKVLQIFHFALKPNGYLFLGNAESAEGQNTLFAPVDKKHRIYSRRAAQISGTIPMLPLRGNWKIKIPESHRTHERERTYSYGEVHYKLVEEYAPPSVLVNEDFDIVHLSESAGPFLRYPGGEPTNSLLKAIHPDLVADLRAALFTTQHEGRASEFPNIRLELEGEEVLVNLIVRPVEIAEAGRDFLLVIIEEANDAKPSPPTTGESIVHLDKDVALETVIRRLEEDLRRTKERLRTTIEQHETSTEELKASNEELQAINEELRSASEELETSKEELQSVNEELTTVNHELKDKIDETGRINSDLQNLMASTDIGTIFLDRALNIKRFTPQVQELFNIIPGDVGRPLDHVTHKLDYGALSADAMSVLRTLKPVERELDASDNNIYIVRVLPYRTIDDKIEGVVMTFVNISDRKRAGAALRELNAWLAGQKEAFHAAVKGAPLEASLDALRTTVINQMGEDVRCAFYVRDTSGTMLHHVAGMPESYARAVDGFRVAEDSLSCGLSAHRGRPVITADVEEDPRWKDWLWLARENDFRGVWSFPLETTKGQTLGTLAMYFHAPREITPRDYEFADVITRTAAIIILRNRENEEFAQTGKALRQSEESVRTERERGQEATRLSEERLQLILQSITDYAVVTTNPEGLINGWNVGAERMFGYPPEEVIGRSAEIIFTAEDRQNDVPRKEMATALQVGRAENERWHLRKDGTRFFASGVMTLLKGRGIEGFVTIARDQTEKLAAERAQREKEILQKLVSAQEDERRRIARDLHDELGQQLTALRLKLEAARKLAEGSDLTSRFDEIQLDAKSIDEGLDFLAWELRPASLDDLGLVAALEKYVNEWTHYAETAAQFIAQIPPDQRFTYEVETNLYRIAQEGLNNVHKHAQAKRVEVSLLRRDEQLVLLIEDDGIGFKPDEKTSRATGIGLIGMQERAALIGGSMEIESAPGKGTRIFVRVPVN